MKRYTSIHSLFIAALVLAFALTRSAYAQDEAVTLNIVIVYGIPGHSAIHLRRGSRQLYWDPGGFYGTEYDDCIELNSVAACRHFAGFPWDALRASRRNDVFSGKNASLLQVLSIYHLDGDPRSEIYTVKLNGSHAENAWRLLDDGRSLGREAAFKTDRQPMFCVKAVTDYLNRLGGHFEDMPRPWFPGLLAAELQQRRIPLTANYSINTPLIQQHIDSVRLTADPPAMFSSMHTDKVRHLTGSP